MVVGVLKRPQPQEWGRLVRALPIAEAWGVEKEERCQCYKRDRQM